MMSVWDTKMKRVVAGALIGFLIGGLAGMYLAGLDLSIYHEKIYRYETRIASLQGELYEKEAVIAELQMLLDPEGP